MCKLNGSRSDTTRCRMDQHRLARAQVSQMKQGLVCGHEHLGYRTGIHQVQIPRDMYRHAVVYARKLGISAAAHDTHDPVAHGEALHQGTGLDHGSGDLQAHGVCVTKVSSSVGALAVIEVGTIDADGGVAYQQVVGRSSGAGSSRATSTSGPPKSSKQWPAWWRAVLRGWSLSKGGHMRRSRNIFER